MQTTSSFIASACLALGMASVTLAGCDDPAKGKAKATTGEAVPVATNQSGTLTAAPQGNVHYVFDQSASKVSWVGSKVTGKHDGGFATFKGIVDVADGQAEKGKVDVDIDATSLTTDAEKLTGHLKSPDFFDVKAFPKATFASTKIEKGGDKGATHTITGNLTIKGITKAVTFPATVKLTSDAADVDAEFAINRRDFSLNYAGMPNDLIRDDVVIKLTIRARKS